MRKLAVTPADLNLVPADLQQFIYDSERKHGVTIPQLAYTIVLMLRAVLDTTVFDYYDNEFDGQRVLWANEADSFGYRTTVMLAANQRDDYMGDEEYVLQKDIWARLLTISTNSEKGSAVDGCIFHGGPLGDRFVRRGSGITRIFEDIAATDHLITLFDRTENGFRMDFGKRYQSFDNNRYILDVEYVYGEYRLQVTDIKVSLRTDRMYI
ncbi:hypothetical protein JNJ66_01535 [Candidatus Saccharibacteria bacterium]|nr:hypothetical protein [Candidatus Saccharibacteria bacterium]